MRIDLDRALTVPLDVGYLDLVVFVVLSFQSDGQSLLLHIQVLGDQNRAFRVFALNVQAEG